MKQRVQFFFAAILVLCLAAASCLVLPSDTAAASAATITSGNIEDTSVMNDLYGANLNGVPFDIRDYPTKANAPVQLVHFAEYGYSYSAGAMEAFGLYVYVYNPGLLNIAIEANNRLQMASSYYGDSVIGYEKYPLQFMSESTGNEEGLFYKFKITFTSEQRSKLLNRLNTHERRYDLSGMEFFLIGQPNARDFEIAETFRFRGFAAGFGGQADAPSTLEAQVDGLRTLSLDVNHTWYRTETSTNGLGWQYQINTVYFSVPNDVLEAYGNLQKIMAEWFEYQTQPIIVTSNESIYNDLDGAIGKHVSHNDSYFSLYLDYDSSKESGLTHPYVASWAYNNTKRYTTVPMDTLNVRELDRYLEFLFLVDNIEEYSSSDLPQGMVSTEMLSDYIRDYDSSYRTGILPILGERVISSDLFTDTAGDGRNRGYNLVEIDAGDSQDLMFYDGVQLNGWWDRLWGDNYTFGDVVSKQVRPIEPLPAEFPSGDDSGLAEDLLIYAGDVQELRDFHAAASGQDETVFLFRYAVSDYFSDWLFAYRENGGVLGIGDDYIYDEAYYAQQTVFLDFDIIQLTFQGELDSYVMPVVSNPQDIISSITPPAYEPSEPAEWWRLILIIIGLLLLLVLLPVLIPYVSLLLSLIALPFRMLVNVFKRRRRGGGT